MSVRWWNDFEAECAAWKGTLSTAAREILFDGGARLPSTAYTREFWSRLFGCDRCYGRGWYPEAVPGTENDYIPDERERYCACPRGEWRMRRGV
jgi:hypothetical protein